VLAAWGLGGLCACRSGLSNRPAGARHPDGWGTKDWKLAQAQAATHDVGNIDLVGDVREPTVMAAKCAPSLFFFLGLQFLAPGKLSLLRHGPAGGGCAQGIAGRLAWQERCCRLAR